jgi:EpsD family peptidyl-prolyl cis-trans isomerase
MWMMGALATVSACSGNSTPSGQVVATVNGEEITRGELNAALPGDAPSDPKAAAKLRNAVLEQIAAQHIVAQEAKREGLDKSQQYLLATRRAENSILSELVTQRVLQGTRTPDDAAVDRYIAANPSRFADRVIFKADQIRAPGNAIDPASLKDVHTMAGVLARFDAVGAQVARSTVDINSAGLEPEATRRLMSLLNGEPYLGADNGILVVSQIVGIEKAPLVGEKARTPARFLMKREAGMRALKNQYEVLRKNAEIKYQDGFGPPAPTATTSPAK